MWIRAVVKPLFYFFFVFSGRELPEKLPCRMLTSTGTFFFLAGTEAVTSPFKGETVQSMVIYVFLKNF
jgi:hypothetical protein